MKAEPNGDMRILQAGRCRVRREKGGDIRVVQADSVFCSMAGCCEKAIEEGGVLFSALFAPDAGNQFQGNKRSAFWVAQKDDQGYAEPLLCLVEPCPTMDEEASVLLINMPRQKAENARRVALLAGATNERFIDYSTADDRLEVVMPLQNGNIKTRVMEGYIKNKVYASLVLEEDREALEEAIRVSIARPSHGSVDVRMVLENLDGGHLLWYRIYHSNLVDENGKVYRIVGRVTDIDSEKKQLLNIQKHAEHDMLTGLYSRGTVERMITTFLGSESSTGSAAKHALMMIDLDNFKQINDSFSHAFGDVVLTEVAAVLKASFRKTDIIGRIGGDEFLILMKNYRKRETIERVAGRICKELVKRYKTTKRDIVLSGSIGIARYPEDGTTLQALYKKADLANYTAKAWGKDRWSFYQETETAVYKSERNGGDDWDEIALLQRDVEEVLLNTLHHENDRVKALEAALAVVGRHFSAHRAYLVMFDETGKPGMDTGAMWCEPGYALDTGDEWYGANLPKALWQYLSTFDEMGLRVARDPSEVPEAVRAVMPDAGTQSILHYAFKRNGKVVGFVGLEDCVRKYRAASPKTLSELEAVSRMLTLFVQNRAPMRQTDRFIETVDIFDNLETYAYIIDVQTHELLFVNRKMMPLIHGQAVGTICYEELHGRKSPCEKCPLSALQEDASVRFASQNMLFQKHGFRGKVFASWCNLGNTQDCCLLQCIDVTPYGG